MNLDSLLLWSNIATLQIIAFPNIHLGFMERIARIFKPGEKNAFSILDITIKDQLKNSLILLFSVFYDHKE